MRVGLVVPGFSADDADWCIPALRHLAQALATTDHVRVIAVRYPYRASRYPLLGAEVITLGGASRRGLATFELWRHTLRTLRGEHRRRPFDVLHAFWATESGLLAVLAGRLLAIPTLVSLAGGELVALPAIGYGDQRIAWERLKVRTCLRLASAVSVGSRQLKRVAERHVDRRRLHRAPLGVDLDLFSPAATDHGARTPSVLHVGTLTKVKDQATLLRAFARLRQQGASATLDFVGDGPLRTDLERLACQLGIADVVRFRGSLDHAVLPAVYRSASVFVLGSRYEAQGMVAIEAAACGTPVVGTCVGVLPELTSALAPVGADESLAHAFAATLADPQPAGRDALARARSNFGLADCAARFRGLYTALTSA